MEQWHRIARLADLVEDEPTAAQVEGRELVVLRHAGAISVFQGECPHQSASLAGGVIENGQLVCPGHGWRFDCATGRRVGEGTACLRRMEARVEGEAVLVCADDVRRWREESLNAEPRSTRTVADLPGPRGIPMLGNLLQLDGDRLHAVLERWADAYGTLYAFRLGPRPVLVTSDPALIQESLRRRPDAYRRLGTIAPVLEEMGVDGVFSAEGARWRRQRSVAMHAFNTRHLRNFFPALAEVTGRLRERWEAAAAEGREVDVREDLKRYTVDITTRLAFGYDLNTLQAGGDVLQRHLEKIFPTLSRRISAPFPYWHFLKLPADRAFDRALAGIREIVAGLIAETRARLAQNPDRAANPTNFLEALLTSRDEDGNRFTEEEILGNTLTILVAGEDTTANTLAWMIHLLALHPAVQETLRSEVDGVLGHAPQLARYEDHDRLPYLGAIAHETMRLKPVAPMLFMETNRPEELGGVQLPAGAAVFLLTRQAGLQESAFAAPREFQPERWLGNAARHPHGAYVPFGSGPRLCPGRNLALLEIEAVASMLCRNFVVEPVPGAVRERFAFTMMPEELRVHLRPRSGNAAASPMPSHPG